MLIDHVNAQFAGEIGTMSIGIGKTIKRYTIGFMYGFEPERDEGGVVSTIVLRNTYSFLTFNDYIDFYGGLNVYHAVGNKYKTSQLHRQKGYYSEASVLALASLGLKARAHKLKGVEFYYEAGINNLWMENYINNTNSVNPFDHVSLSLGLIYHFP